MGGGDASSLTVLGQRAYFSAFTPDFGRELWSTNGTPEGTRRVTDIAPGPASSSPSALAAIGNRLYFAANDAVVGRESYVFDPCSADFNGDGHIDPDDLSDYIACYFAARHAALGI